MNYKLKLEVRDDESDASEKKEGISGKRDVITFLGEIINVIDINMLILN